MKKLAKVIVSIIMVLFCVWFMLSWIDVVADDTHHHKYNMFVLMVQEKQEEEYTGACGNPLDGTTKVGFGIINEIKENTVVFLMDEGELIEVEVGDPQDFNPDRYYCLFFQGDEVFKAWEEHW